MSEDEVLDATGEHAAAITRAETELIELAYQWAVLHPAGRLDARELWHTPVQLVYDVAD